MLEDQVLCNVYFPLVSNFEDLCFSRGNAVFSMDPAKQYDQNATAVLRTFIAEMDRGSKISAGNSQNGLCLVEALYLALQWARSEKRSALQNIICSMFTSLLWFMRSSLQRFQHEWDNVNVHPSVQNNIRVCVFFLCHGISIVEDCLHIENGAGKTKPKPLDDSEWLGLKAKIFSEMVSLLHVLDAFFNSEEEKMVAKEIMQATAVSCLLHQKWTHRAAKSRAHLQILKSGLLAIISDPFIKPCTNRDIFRVFETLMQLCVQCNSIISFMTLQTDVIELVLLRNELSGVSILTQIVAWIVEKYNTKAEAELEMGMAILADFSSRKDAFLITSLYIGKLLPLMHNERIAIRKYFADIICGCLQQTQILCPKGIGVLCKFFIVLLKDRDAICRLRILAKLTADTKWIYLCDQNNIQFFLTEITKRCLDTSKTVRMKALQVLETFFSALVDMEAEYSIFIAESEAISTAFKLLALSPDSSYYCVDTMEAASKFLCMPCLKVSAIYNHLCLSLDYSYGSAGHLLLLKILHFHLDDFTQWNHFLTTLSDDVIKRLISLLMVEVDGQSVYSSRYQKIVESAYRELGNCFTSRCGSERYVGCCITIATLSSVTDLAFPADSDAKESLLLRVMEKLSTKLVPPIENEAVQTNKRALEWSLKAMVSLTGSNGTSKDEDIRSFIKQHCIVLQEAGIPSAIDLLYSRNDPFGLVKEILQSYEIQLQGDLDPCHWVNLFRCYIHFLGDISRSHSLACTAFVTKFRKARETHEKTSFTETSSDLEYLQHEEQKRQEEDAVHRFSKVLAAEDAVPGCYVVFLDQMTATDDVPNCLKTIVVTSLEKHFLTNFYVANTYKGVIEKLLESSDTRLLVSALKLAENMLLTYPNDFLHLLPFIVSFLKNGQVKKMAYCICARLLLEQKLKPDMLIGSICDGLCDDEPEVKMLVVFVLKRLLETAGKCKHMLILELYRHGSCSEVRQTLAEVLVQNLLDPVDLRNDDLTSSVLQLLANGQDDAAVFASFLTPSQKVLGVLDNYLSSCPPRICLENTGTKNYIATFVNNHKQQGCAFDKDLVAKLLNIIQGKSVTKRKRKNEMKGIEDSFNSIKEYEEAIQSFRSCKLSEGLSDIFLHDI